jgi:hypothetical protein
MSVCEWLAVVLWLSFVTWVMTGLAANALNRRVVEARRRHVARRRERLLAGYRMTGQPF